jgi:hypothetical protein
MKKLLSLLALAPLLMGSGYSAGGHQMGATTKTATVVIATDVDLSEEVDLEDYSLINIMADSAMDGTDIKFHCSGTSGGTFIPLYDDAGTICDATFAASQGTATLAGACTIALAACRFLKIETVTDQATTNTVFTLALKR